MNSPHRTAVTAWQRLWQAGKTREEAGQASVNRTKKCRRPKKKKSTEQTILRNFHQLNLHQNSQTVNDAKIYGDDLKDKNSSTFRVAFHNINCLTIDYRSSKGKKTINNLFKIDADVFAMAEIGLYWPKVDPRDLWHH